MKASIIKYRLGQVQWRVDHALEKVSEAKTEQQYPRHQRDAISDAMNDIRHARVALDRADDLLDAEWERSKAREEEQG